MSDAQGRELGRLVGTQGNVTAAAITGDGKRALTGGMDNTVRLWDVDKAKELFCLRGQEGSVTYVQFAPDGATAFSGDDQGRIIAWDLIHGTQLPAFRPKPKHKEVRFLAVSADGRCLLSTGQGKEGVSDNLCLWNAKTGDLLLEDSSVSAHGESVALSSDGRWALIAEGSSFDLWRL